MPQRSLQSRNYSPVQTFQFFPNESVLPANRHLLQSTESNMVSLTLNRNSATSYTTAEKRRNGAATASIDTLTYSPRRSPRIDHTTKQNTRNFTKKRVLKARKRSSDAGSQTLLSFVNTCYAGTLDTKSTRLSSGVHVVAAHTNDTK